MTLAQGIIHWSVVDDIDKIFIRHMEETSGCLDTSSCVEDDSEDKEEA